MPKKKRKRNRSAIAADLRTPKYRARVVATKKMKAKRRNVVVREITDEEFEAIMRAEVPKENRGLEDD